MIVDGRAYMLCILIIFILMVIYIALMVIFYNTKNFKKISIAATIVFIVGVGGVFAANYYMQNNITNITLNKMLKESGYSSSTSNPAKIAATIDLKNDINGLEKSDKNKLMLITANERYCFVIANAITRKLVVPELAYVPLNVVQIEIWNSDKAVNIKCASVFKKYIEKYGVYCLSEKEYAEEYLREITGKKGIIATSRAQDIISNSTMQIFPDITSNDEVTVLFEEGSAVPMYYTTRSSKMVYNWNGIFDESVYKVWEANAELRTQRTMRAMYGEPYTLKECWAVVDSDLKEVGTYDSLEAVKRKLLKK